ncbi:Stp1/IreP family PP2C-type Ser/Thr phosphatase [Ideonella sp. TBM-1]|uniref:Stp1/IreP family PP2C-type Ser/Thr phosphatase n=1 Tax=Ideonella livida TaxID=2707176 RepID=A0A7C9TK30_9BURK|nr:Stp1/IreP family PP2C-type Ser/Thr phosphatase [Ideonella livida]
MSLEYFSALDPGRARRNNEDAVLVDESLALCLLADGMGGYNAGEVASDMAIREARDEFARWVASGQVSSSEGEVRRALVASARRANRSVYAAAQRTPEYAGMGTTLVQALFGVDRMWVGHVGDSRAYRFRQNKLEQITRDHSLLQEQIDAGLITPEEAKFSAHRNLVTKAVGVEPEIDPEVHGHDLRVGDLILMCSDGLSDMVPDAQIADILRLHPTLPAMGKALIDAANAAGGRDNISVVLAKVQGDAAAARRLWWPFNKR